MNYYKRHLGDYAKKAGRLSMLQHGSYTLLIDSCYDREEFPTIEQAIEWTWASTPEEIAAVKFVLSKFFVLENGVYVQKRIQEELADFKNKSEKNTRIAIDRETKRKETPTKRVRLVHVSPPVVHETPPNARPSTNQEPLTTNQEPRIQNISPERLTASEPESGFSIPLNDGSEHAVAARTLAEWVKSFPAVDVEQELREMRVWAMANPTKRKTKRGIESFAVRWLAKAQDTPARSGGRQAPEDWTRAAV